MNQRKKIALYLAAIFLAALVTGGLLGAALAKSYILQPPRPEALASQIQRELTRKLDLDASQQKKTRIIIDNSMARIMGIYSETIWKIDAELLVAQNALTSELTPEQLNKLKDLANDRQDFQKHVPVAPVTVNPRQ